MTSKPKGNKLSNEQIEQIKAQIKKMMPSRPQKNAIHEKETIDKPIMRKTISHLINVFPQHINSQQSYPRMSQTHQNFNTKKNVLKNKNVNKLLQTDQPQTDHMLNWRQEMMRHIRPQRIVNSQTQSKKEHNFPFHKMVEQTRAPTAQKKIFMVKSPLNKARSKSNFNLKQLSPQSNSQSYKNLIIIRPTTISQQEANKVHQKPKKTIFRTNKESPIDKFFQQKQAHFDEMSLQRIANFEALLPFLGAHRASVEQKPDKRYTDYDPTISIKKTNVRKKRKKSPLDAPEKITGWEVTQQKEL